MGEPCSGNQGWLGGLTDASESSEFLETALLRGGGARSTERRFENIQGMVDRCLSLYNNRFNSEDIEFYFLTSGTISSNSLPELMRR